MKNDSIVPGFRFLLLLLVTFGDEILLFLIGDGDDTFLAGLVSVGFLLVVDGDDTMLVIVVDGDDDDISSAGLFWFGLLSVFGLLFFVIDGDVKNDFTVFILGNGLMADSDRNFIDVISGVTACHAK